MAVTHTNSIVDFNVSSFYFYIFFGFLLHCVCSFGHLVISDLKQKLLVISLGMF